MMRRESRTIGNTTHFNGSPWYVGNFSDTAIRRAYNPQANYEYNAWNMKLSFVLNTAPSWQLRGTADTGARSLDLSAKTMLQTMIDRCSWKLIRASYRWTPLDPGTLYIPVISSSSVVVEQTFEVGVFLARRILSFGLWCSIVQQMFTDVSEETASISESKYKPRKQQADGFLLLAYSSIVNMEAVRSSETSVKFLPNDTASQPVR
jgi:hypothetical protein